MGQVSHLCRLFLLRRRADSTTAGGNALGDGIHDVRVDPLGGSDDDAVADNRFQDLVAGIAGHYQVAVGTDNFASLARHQDFFLVYVHAEVAGKKVAHPIVVVAAQVMESDAPFPAVKKRVEQVGEAFGHDRFVLEVEIENITHQEQGAVPGERVEKADEAVSSFRLAGDFAAAAATRPPPI